MYRYSQEFPLDKIFRKLKHYAEMLMLSASEQNRLPENVRYKI